MVGTKELSEAEFKCLTLIGDETRIGQISNNLTNNAIKFTPFEGTVAVTASILSSTNDVAQLWEKESSQFESKFVYDTKLSTATSSTNVVYFTFSVRDTGCGIPSSDLSSIFDAYKQVSSGVTKTYQGTGLGLHIVKLHIDSMNGMIAVASQPKRGTMFFFAVPLKVGLNGTADMVLSEMEAEVKDSRRRKLDEVDEVVNEIPKVIQPDSIFLVVCMGKFNFVD